MDCGIAADGFRILINGIHAQLSAGADNLVRSRIARPEAGRERSQPLPRKTQDRRSHFVYFPEARLAVVGARGEHFERFRAKKVARGIDAINTDVIERSSAEFLLQPDIALFDVPGEYRIENPRFAELAGLQKGNHLQIGAVEMKPVSDHQFDAAVLRGPDHGFAFLRGHGHRFFAKDVYARLRGAHGELAVHAVGQGNVDRVQLPALKADGIILVRQKIGHAVLPPQFFELKEIVGKKSDQLGVLGM